MFDIDTVVVFSIVSYLAKMIRLSQMSVYRVKTWINFCVRYPIFPLESIFFFLAKVDPVSPPLLARSQAWLALELITLTLIAVIN